jgi:chlorite dismutase
MMTAMANPLVPTNGWGVLHLFCRTQAGWSAADLLAAEEAALREGNQVVAVALIGHKADVGLMVLGADMWSLRRFQTNVQAAGFEPVASYVSMTEVSEYASGVPDERKEARLHPRLPPEGKRAFCFYPMSKRRNADRNWYALDFETRRQLMFGHGEAGRAFAGRIVQVVTGSTGLDDYEWGVTLFGSHPDDIKDCVYQMRFDEASAQYAEFGPFYTGVVGGLAEVLVEAAGWQPQ